MVTALDGLRVLDISEGLAAPFAAKLLGDLGADVIISSRPAETPPADVQRTRKRRPRSSSPTPRSDPFTTSSRSGTG